MATNPYFNHLTYNPTQTMMEDLLVESIKMYGMDIIYLPRTLIDVDSIWGEADHEQFNSGVAIEMYLNNVEGFEGNGDLMSKFGLQIRDQATFWVSSRRFQEEFESTDLAYNQLDGTTQLTRIAPREGDLLYMPMNGKLFEIMFVQDEKMFYPQGKRMLYELTCELFERSHEDFNIANTLIDISGTETDFGGMYPQSNTETSGVDDSNEFGIGRDNIFDFSEDNPWSEQW
jgi:hypothetical protein